MDLVTDPRDQIYQCDGPTIKPKGHAATFSFLLTELVSLLAESFALTCVRELKRQCGAPPSPLRSGKAEWHFRDGNEKRANAGDSLERVSADEYFVEARSSLARKLRRHHSHAAKPRSRI
jgi:hypothetical protein